MNKTESIKHARCIHMPAPQNTVIIFVSKRGKLHEAGFTIYNQDFTIAECETKKGAQWFCDVLEAALLKLITPTIVNKLKNEENKKQVIKDLYIKVNNLR